MEKHLLLYKCDLCGYVLEVLDIGKRTLHEDGQGYTRNLTVADAHLICCEKPMRLISANTEEASAEKHLPEARFDGDKLIVRVGSKLHPMTDEHHIEWVTILYGDTEQRSCFEPGDEPVVEFNVGKTLHAKVYAYCNLHGLWLTEVKR